MNVIIETSVFRVRKLAHVMEPATTEFFKNSYRNSVSPRNGSRNNLNAVVTRRVEDEIRGKLDIIVESEVHTLGGETALRELIINYNM